MRKISFIATITIKILIAFNSCAPFTRILESNECAMKGCTNDCAVNSKYCTKHLDGIPDNFDKDMKESVDKQVNKYNDNLDKK